METALLHTADILDIIFDGRNKAYGAYDLRRNYNKRLLTAMMVMGSLVLLLVIGYLVSNYQSTYNKKVGVVVDVPLEPDPHKDVDPPTPPPLKKLSIVETTIYTLPRITKEEDIKPEEKPPEVETLENAKIGDVNQKGIQDGEITSPPADTKGVVEIPREITGIEKTFTKVEIESEYPGGAAAWARYLNRNFTYPDEAREKEIVGTVVVKFIVDKEGKVSDVEAVSGPNELRDEAIRVIMKSGNWTSAIQNGRNVKSYKSQAIVFKLESQ